MTRPTLTASVGAAFMALTLAGSSGAAEPSRAAYLRQAQKAAATLAALAPDAAARPKARQDLAASYHRLANHMHRKGRDNEALLWYRKASAADPEGRDSLLGMAAIFKDQGRFAEARARLDSYLKVRTEGVLHQEAARLLYHVEMSEGRYLEEKDRFADCLRLFDKARELSWDQSSREDADRRLQSVHFVMGHLAQTRRAFTESARAFMASLDRNVDPEIYARCRKIAIPLLVRLGKNAYNEDNGAQAAEYFRAVESHAPAAAQRADARHYLDRLGSEPAAPTTGGIEPPGPWVTEGPGSRPNR